MEIIKKQTKTSFQACRWVWVMQMDREVVSSVKSAERRGKNSSTSCRFLFRLVNYSACYHLQWPFRGQNNLGFSCLWFYSGRCPYQSCYKIQACVHTHPQSLTSTHFILFVANLLPERFLCFLCLVGFLLLVLLRTFPHPRQSFCLWE